MVSLPRLLLAASLVVASSAQTCPVLSCADLGDGMCAKLTSKTTVQLNNAKCPPGTACQLISMVPYMGMMDMIPMFPFPYSCPAYTPPTPVPYTPQACATKVASKNWKAGGTTLFCTSKADCVMQDGTTAACMCLPRADKKSVCVPDVSNTDVFGDYWTMCTANNNMIPTEEAYNYWTLLIQIYPTKDADLSCKGVFAELEWLAAFKTIYMCSIGDASCPCTGATFLDKATVTCSPCNGNCATCKTGSADSCKTCPAGSTLGGTAPNTCNCPSDKFPDPTAANCSACDTSCLSCSGSGTSNCTACKTNAKLANGVCSCPILNGFYGGPTNCAACHSSCKTCDGPTANDCRNPCGTTNPDGSCSSCLTGFYLDAGKCMVCDKTCATCSAAGADKCDTCHSGGVLNSGVCSCNSGFYLDFDLTACTACDATCSTCSTKGATSCTGCKANATLGSGACTCNNGFYWKTDTKLCDTCAGTCATCQTSASTCKSCKTGATLSGSACSCTSGSPDASSCVLCNSSCAGCTYTAPNVCTSCSSTLFLVNGVCRGCPDTCTTCSDTDCSGCFSNAVLTTTTPKRCACNSGFYPNPTVTSCSPCDLSCKSCSGPGSNSCLGCYAPAQLSGSACVCPSGSYPNPGANLCASCEATCLACSAAGTDKCTSCKTGATLSSGTCNCNAGTFPNPDASQCTACDVPCLTCSGAGVNMCLTCGANAQLSGTAPGACVCAAGLTGTPATGCLVCHSTCQTCKDATASSCQSCKLGAVLSGAVPSTCVCTTGYLSQPDAANCVPCDIFCSPESGLPPCLEKCSKCSGSTCTACVKGSNLQPTGSSCLPTCPPGFYSSSTVCTPCTGTCVTCSSATNCLSCDSEHILKGTACVRNCESNYFSLDDSECIPCDTSCETCDGPLTTSCVTCKTGYFLSGGVCSPCDISCATCNAKGSCLTCPVGYNLTAVLSCHNCKDCDQPITVTLGNPKPNVYSVDFSRPVSHYFLPSDFEIQTTPPAKGLQWVVENNPIPTRRRLQADVSLVYINIIAGEWDPSATFQVAFSKAAQISDIYGNSLPSTLNFTTTAPLGPEITESSDEGPSDGTIAGAVVGSFVGTCLLVLAFLWFLKWRKTHKKASAKKYKEVAGEQSAQFSG